MDSRELLVKVLKCNRQLKIDVHSYESIFNIKKRLAYLLNKSDELVFIIKGEIIPDSVKIKDLNLEIQSIAYIYFDYVLENPVSLRENQLTQLRDKEKLLQECLKIKKKITELREEYEKLDKNYITFKALEEKLEKLEKSEKSEKSEILEILKKYFDSLTKKKDIIMK